MQGLGSRHRFCREIQWCLQVCPTGYRHAHGPLCAPRASSGAIPALCDNETRAKAFCVLPGLFGSHPFFIVQHISSAAFREWSCSAVFRELVTMSITRCVIESVRSQFYRLVSCQAHSHHSQHNPGVQYSISRYRSVTIPSHACNMLSSLTRRDRSNMHLSAMLLQHLACDDHGTNSITHYVI